MKILQEKRQIFEEKFKEKDYTYDFQGDTMDFKPN